MAGKNTSLQNEYISRINKTLDYIETNINNQFTLEELASVATFSKFHFHRIFFAAIGETPFQLIQRLRLEKAAALIASNENESISEIAAECGFSDISIFSRNFKKHFDTTASAYRAEKSNLSQVLRNKQQEEGRAIQYFCTSSNTIKWKTSMKQQLNVEVKDLPKMTLAYVRHIGPYKGDNGLFERLWNKLFTWAGPRNLIGPETQSLAIYHDDPNITDDDKLRVSVCITVAQDTKVDGEIGKMELEAAKYVMARFKIDATQFEMAWKWVYGEWLPNSGYQPDDKPCFEMFPKEPKDGLFTVDICVPVKPL